jgi:UDP-GlcNAc:undecaprenyl-phosphate GlcNAc-1-phosphate transferase
MLTRLVEPDREHIHHQLMALGWSTRQVVTVLYLLTMMLSALALFTVRFD